MKDPILFGSGGVIALAPSGLSYVGGCAGLGVCCSYSLEKDSVEVACCMLVTRRRTHCGQSTVTQSLQTGSS